MLLFKPMVHEVVRVPFSNNCFLNSLSLCLLSSLPYYLLSLQSALLSVFSASFSASPPCSLCSLHPSQRALSLSLSLSLCPLVAGPGDYIQGTAAMGLLLGARPFPEKRGGGVGKGTPKGKEGKGVKAKGKRYKVTKGEWYKVVSRTVGEIRSGEVGGDK